MKVKIKDWYDMAEQYGIDEDGNIKCRYIFATEMKEYCGKVIEVEDVNIFTYDNWVFSNEMYEVVEKWDKGKMKVRIKEWDTLAEEFGIDEDGNIDCLYSFTTDMKECCGKIIEVNEDNLLEPDIINIFVYEGWFFTDEMFDVIE